MNKLNQDAMSQSSHDSQNPYASPETPAAAHLPGLTWRRAFTALVGVILPCALVWGYMDASYLWPAAEPENSVKTPNPEKAPWYFVSGTENWMAFVNPRLAFFAHWWTYLVYGAVVLWPFAGPFIFPRKAEAATAARHAPRVGLFAASLLLGAFLAWPWLAALFVPGLFGP